MGTIGGGRNFRKHAKAAARRRSPKGLRLREGHSPEVSAPHLPHLIPEEHRRHQRDDEE